MGAWSDLVVGAFFGHWRMGELTLATHLLDRIPTGSLLLVDRLYEAMLDALAACELPRRRKGRTCRREVRVKMSKYKKKWKKAA